MKSTDALLERWARTLASRKEAPAIFNPGGGVVRTFQGVDTRARELEAKLRSFDAGSVIAIQIGNHQDWPSFLPACLRARLVVLPLERSISDTERDAALVVCRAAAVVTAVGGGGAIKITKLRQESVPAVLRDSDAGAAAASAGAADPAEWWGRNPPSLLKLTSGTTATPRAVRFRSQQLVADCENICATMGITGADLNFGVIPVSHSYGFSNLLIPLLVRGVPLVLSRDRTPRAVLADLARSNATVFPGMPVFYQALCKIEDIPPLPRLRLCISAGAPLPGAVAREFREKFKLPIHSFYGASECGGICYDREAADQGEGFVGAPMENVRLEIVQPAAPSSQVRVRSAAAGDGYFPQPDAEKLGGGIFVPDDLLTRKGPGFKITGRISDMVNVAGKKVSPAEVEARLLSFPGVRQAVVFGRESTLRSEEVVACVVSEPGVRESELLEICRQELSAWQVPKRIYIVDAIPVNERGKISRRALARQWL
jgi:long-chain acyl-CoA synthetase